jgi:CRISPR-associated endoribonuclease Cas6
LLLAAVIFLSPLYPATISANLGRAVHAWFLGQVQRADPALAERLHEPNRPRPFTVSSLRGVGPATEGKIALTPKRDYWLRVTSMEATLSRCLLERILPALPSEIELAGATFRLKGATCDPAEHAWAGQTTYEALVKEYLLRTGKVEPRLTLQFASPTTFRRTAANSSLTDSEGKAYKVAGHNVPLPLPGLVFDSYLQRWNAFAPVAFPLEVKRYAEECVAISRYRLQTVLVEFGEVREVGFVGTCRFTALVPDPYWLRLLHLLAAFAFYSGTGHHTARGMGQTGRVPNLSSEVRIEG